MITAPELALYFALVFGIIALPGMDMAFVVGNSLVGGLRSGAGAVAGIVVGGVCHMTMGALGVAIVVRAVPWLFTLMMLAGAAYIAWIGWSLWRAGGAADQPEKAMPDIHAPAAVARSATPASAFRGAVATSLLNPKAYLFTLAVTPQFLHPERGDFWLQVAQLTTVTNATQAGVYGALAVAASRGAAWFKSNPRSRMRLMKAVGAGLIAMAALTAVEATLLGGNDRLPRLEGSDAR
jgi:threonine/homoserine/homoserine lactone efflux protein